MLFTERNFAIVDTLRDVAAELDVPMARAALAWVLSRPGVDSLLLGASRPEQVESNIAALELAWPPSSLPGSTRPARCRR